MQKRITLVAPVKRKPRPIMPIKPKDVVRLMRRIKVGRDGCWNWTGGVAGDNYGAFYHGGRQVYTHRFSYELFVGVIPEHLQVDHLCRNHSCCNPKHLELVSGRENKLRGTGASARNAWKRYCVNGHPLYGDNLILRKFKGNIQRGCRKCRSLYDDGYYSKNRSKILSRKVAHYKKKHNQ